MADLSNRIPPNLNFICSNEDKIYIDKATGKFTIQDEPGNITMFPSVRPCPQSRYNCAKIGSTAYPFNPARPPAQTTDASLPRYNSLAITGGSFVIVGSNTFFQISMHWTDPTSTRPMGVSTKYKTGNSQVMIDEAQLGAMVASAASASNGSKVEGLSILNAMKVSEANVAHLIATPDGKPVYDAELIGTAIASMKSSTDTAAQAGSKDTGTTLPAVPGSDTVSTAGRVNAASTRKSTPQKSTKKSDNFGTYVLAIMACASLCILIIAIAIYIIVKNQ